MIVDAHMHLWRKIDGMVGGKTPVRPLGNGMIQVGAARMLGMPATHLDCSAPAEWAVSEFDAAGVDGGVVVQEYLDGQQNDYLLEVQARYPSRFFVHALPNFWNREGVARETAALFDRGFRGLKLPANHLAAGDVRLDDAGFMPIWDRMEAEGKVLAVDLCEGESQVPAMENILRHHPALHVALGHFGMVNRRGWPGQLRLCRHEHVYMETGGIVWLFRHEGYPFPGALAAIRKAKQEVGIDKLMWGSDWPRAMVDFTYRQSLDFIRREESLDASCKELLLGGNAARLYGLSLSGQPREPVPLITEG